MVYKLILWLLKFTSREQQKAITLGILDSILRSKDSSIDKQFAEMVVEKCIRSTGNKITAFIVKD